MNVAIYLPSGTKAGERALPVQFHEEYRPDLIRRAVLALRSAARQSYGATPEAGLRHSSRLSKRRRKYRGCYGLGISRVNRKILSRRGTRMNWVGAFSPQTVGGHRAHPPKAAKIWAEKINLKERRKAIRSAIAATVNKQAVQQRGHILPANYPFIADSTIEKASRTKEVEAMFQALGFKQELARAAWRKVRAGKGKMRGRKYRQKRSVLVVVSKICPLLKAAANIPGVEVVAVRSLNAALLAPGAMPGRITLWTEQSLHKMEQEELFL